MSIQTVLDPTNDLVEQAKRVLPGGSFGNMPAEVILRAGKGGRIWDEHGKGHLSKAVAGKMRHSIFVPIE